MLFAEQLQTLPSVDHIAQLQLIDEQEQTVATIDNVPGKSGSVRVYAALAAKHGALNVAAAQEGRCCLLSTRLQPKITQAAIPISIVCLKLSPAAKACA